MPPPVKHRYNTRGKTRRMEDQIKELSEKVEEMQTVTEAVQEMQNQMAQLMQFVKAGKMVEREPFVKDPQFPPRFTSVHYPQPTGSSSHAQEGQARGQPYPLEGYPVATNPAQHFTNQGENVNDPVIIHDSGEAKKKSISQSIEEVGAKQKLESLEERLRAIEGVDAYGAINTSDLCLVTDVVIPPKFKVPEFEKYDAKGCPATHLAMYIRKMAAYTHDDKLLIHFFQDSLTRNAATWYVKLDQSKIRSWKDLAGSFLNHYKYLMEMAPSRIDLQAMEKRSNETFKGYAQRWRDLAAQVQPPLSENELETLFISTLKAPYYEKLVSHTSGSFSHLVIAGERIDEGIRKGKIHDSSAENKRSFREKQEGEVQAVDTGSYGNYRPSYHPEPPIYPYPPYNPYQPIYPQVNGVSQGPRQYSSTLRPNYQPNRHHTFSSSTPTSAQPMSSFLGRSDTKNDPKTIEPIPMSYTELLPKLIENHQLAPIPVEPLKPPYPGWYNPNARCDYHGGIIGHSTENCTALKYKVQALRDAKWLNFSQSPAKPNVNRNPLPDHENGIVSAHEGGPSAANC